LGRRQDYLSGTAFADGYATSKACFDSLWAIWRVKSPAHNDTRILNEPEGAPKSVQSKTSKKDAHPQVYDAVST
jgi:hypothetical protein